MATTPYGCISVPMTTLRTMLSYCPSWQQWVEEVDGAIPASGDARAAFTLDYIHLGYYLKPSSGFVYPFAVVEVPETTQYEAIAQGAAGAVFDTGGGSLNIKITRDIPDAKKDTPEAAYLDFAGIDTDGVKTGLGAIIADLQNLSDTVDQLENFNIDVLEAPRFWREEVEAVEGLVAEATLKIDWGVT